MEAVKPQRLGLLRRVEIDPCGHGCGFNRANLSTFGHNWVKFAHTQTLSLSLSLSHTHSIVFNLSYEHGADAVQPIRN